MTTTASNVEVAVTGEVSFAPAGSTLPTDATTALDAAFAGLGYNSSDGIDEQIDEQRNTITAWQNGDEVRSVKSSQSVTYSFTMLETNADTLDVYYGEGSYSAGTVQVKGDAKTRGCWVIETYDGTKKLRIVIPDGEITARGTVKRAGTDAVMYQVTVTCYPVSGVKATHYRGVVA